MKKQKLIRDKIPEICPDMKTHIAGDNEYYLELLNKLEEETDEYRKDQTIEELVDIIEVVYAISEFKGKSIKEFEEIRKEKAQKRGRFKKRIICELNN